MASARGASKPLEGNTRLREADGHFVVSLHGNDIVRLYPDHTEASHGGFVTKTTVDRLNKYFQVDGLGIANGQIVFRGTGVRLPGDLRIRPRLHAFPESGWVTLAVSGKITGSVPAPDREFVESYRIASEAFCDRCEQFVVELKRAPKPSPALSSQDWLELLFAMAPSEAALGSIYPGKVKGDLAATLLNTADAQLSSEDSAQTATAGAIYYSAVTQHLAKIRKETLSAFAENVRRLEKNA